MGGKVKDLGFATTDVHDATLGGASKALFLSSYTNPAPFCSTFAGVKLLAPPPRTAVNSEHYAA